VLQVLAHADFQTFWRSAEARTGQRNDRVADVPRFAFVVIFLHDERGSHSCRFEDVFRVELFVPFIPLFSSRKPNAGNFVELVCGHIENGTIVLRKDNPCMLTMRAVQQMRVGPSGFLFHVPSLSFHRNRSLPQSSPYFVRNLCAGQTNRKRERCFSAKPIRRTVYS